LSRFGNPLVILLLAAATISAFTGDIASFVIIGFVVVLSVTLDFVQEFRAGRAAERLKTSVTLRPTVLRSGRPIEIAANQIAPGDRVRKRDPQLRPPHPAARNSHGPLRAAGERAVPPTVARIVPVCRGARRRAHTRAAADGGFRDARPGRPSHGEGTGHRPAT